MEAENRLSAGIGRCVVVRRGYRGVGWRAVIASVVVMIEGGDGQNRIPVEGVNPGKDRIAVRFPLAVAERMRIKLLVLEVVRVWIVGNLVVVLAQLPVEAKLIFGVEVVEKRRESSVAVFGVVVNLCDRRFQAKIASVSIHTRVVGESLGVTPKVDLFVCLIKVPEGRHKFAIVVFLKSRSRQDIEFPIGAVAKCGIVAAAQNLHVVDILGIDLRSEVGGNICIRNGDAVDEPGGLVAPPHVQHVVCEVCARGEIGDHRDAVRAVGAGSACDILAVNECGGGG